MIGVCQPFDDETAAMGCFLLLQRGCPFDDNDRSLETSRRQVVNPLGTNAPKKGHSRAHASPQGGCSLWRQIPSRRLKGFGPQRVNVSPLTSCPFVTASHACSAPSHPTKSVGPFHAVPNPCTSRAEPAPLYLHFESTIMTSVDKKRKAKDLSSPDAPDSLIPDSDKTKRAKVDDSGSSGLAAQQVDVPKAEEKQQEPEEEQMKETVPETLLFVRLPNHHYGREFAVRALLKDAPETTKAKPEYIQLIRSFRTAVVQQASRRTASRRVQLGTGLTCAQTPSYLPKEEAASKDIRRLCREAAELMRADDDCEQAGKDTQTDCLVEETLWNLMTCVEKVAVEEGWLSPVMEHFHLMIMREPALVLTFDSSS